RGRRKSRLYRRLNRECQTKWFYEAPEVLPVKSDVGSLKSAKVPVMVRIALFVAALVSIFAGLQEPRLADRADAAVARSGVTGGRLGILIYTTRAEAPVYDRDSKKVLRLASNTKLLTT